MATRVKVSTKGLEDTFEKLAQMGRDLDAAADAALMAGAKVFQTGMKRRAPKDTHNLEEHIKIAGPFQDGNFHYLSVGVIHDIDFTDAETARYANNQEYGNSSMEAQPYIRPTIDEDSKAASKAMRDVLLEALK